MGRRNRECYLCGADYTYCPTCSNDKMKPSWMAEFHDENCKSIFDICTRFNMGLLTKEQSQEALASCDISNKSAFKSYVQRDLENIFAEDHKRGKRAEMKVVDEAFAPIAELSESHEVVEKEN